MARILIIDDADHMREVLKLTLEFKGHHVDAAADGAAGLALALANNYNIIFCDIEMPVMNGIDFVARQRAQAGPDVPIIMLTAEGDELVKKALAAGATAVLHKPFEPLRVLKEVEAHVG